MITAGELRRQLSYEPITGVFVWRVSNNNTIHIGDVAGSVNGGGYVDIGIGNRIYRASRLAWLYMTGVWPRNVDHKNLNKTDNRWSNLRDCTRSMNGANRKALSNNTSGFKGVSRSRNQWAAMIRVDYQAIWLGRFDTPEEAHAAYVAAAKEHFGEYAHEG